MGPLKDLDCGGDHDLEIRFRNAIAAGAIAAPLGVVAALISMAVLGGGHGSGFALCLFFGFSRYLLSETWQAVFLPLTYVAYAVFGAFCPRSFPLRASLAAVGLGSHYYLAYQCAQSEAPMCEAMLRPNSAAYLVWGVAISLQLAVLIWVLIPLAASRKRVTNPG